MKLSIVTPLDVVAAEDGVTSLRAEDATGSFGIWPGHAEFLTALSISVASWKGAGGAWRHCALRGGTLTVGGGDTVVITSREAVVGDDLETLDQTVLARFRAEMETERSERTESTRLHLAAIRQIMQHLRKAGTTGMGGSA